MTSSPDREPAPSQSPPTGYSSQFHAEAAPRQSIWKRALQRFQSWHPTLRVTLVASVLWGSVRGTWWFRPSLR